MAHEQEFMLLKRLERYFLEEVAARVARACSCQLLADLESQLPEWITAIPVVGTPRYAILRVYRGLVDDPADEPGWQHYKPSAIPAGDQARVQAACVTLADLRAFQEVAKDMKRVAIWAVPLRSPAAPRSGPPRASRVGVSGGVPGAQRGERAVSVLEKGDFFSEARQALQRALELEPQYTPAHLALGRFLVMTAYRGMVARQRRGCGICSK